MFNYLHCSYKPGQCFHQSHKNCVCDCKFVIVIMATITIPSDRCNQVTERDYTNSVTPDYGY